MNKNTKTKLVHTFIHTVDKLINRQVDSFGKRSKKRGAKDCYFVTNVVQ